MSISYFVCKGAITQAFSRLLPTQHGEMLNSSCDYFTVKCTKCINEHLIMEQQHLVAFRHNPCDNVQKHSLEYVLN